MKSPLFKILKNGQPTAVFVGPEQVATTCFETLRTSFFFVAGSAKPITEPFPFTLEPAKP